MKQKLSEIHFSAVRQSFVCDLLCVLQYFQVDMYIYLYILFLTYVKHFTKCLILSRV